MDKPFKFRHAREIAGGFVLLGLLILTLAIVVQGRVKGWFEPKTVYEVVLPKAGTQGIQAGSDVHILGSKVGKVKRIEMRQTGSSTRLVDFHEVPAEQIELVAILEVRGGRSVFVGKNSKAVLKKDLAGFGSAYFELTRAGGAWPSGTDSPAPKLLLFEGAQDVQNEVTNVVKEIRDSIIPALDKIQVASEEFATLAKSLSQEDGGFQQSLSGLEEMVSTINAGEGVVGAMLKDEEMEADFRKSLTQIQEATSELNSTLGRVESIVAEVEKGEGAAGLLLSDKDAAAKIESAVGNIDRASNSMRESMVNLDQTTEQFPEVVAKWNSAVDGFGKAAQIMQEALREYEILARGVQDHPLIRGSVDRVKLEEIEESAGPSTSGSGTSSRKKTPQTFSVKDYQRTKNQTRTLFRDGRSLGEKKNVPTTENSPRKDWFPFFKKSKDSE